jgi:predicted dehydrogenase
VTRSVKILGAGSIGNHLAHAARRLGWAVHLCDVDPAALERTRHEIYPGRYGEWDDEISLTTVDEAPRGGHDLIVVGTPPDVHVPVALDAVAESPAALLIEKPICAPDLDGAQALLDACESSGVRAFVGYDHVVSPSVTLVRDRLREPRSATRSRSTSSGASTGAACSPRIRGSRARTRATWATGAAAAGGRRALARHQPVAAPRPRRGAGGVVRVDATVRYARTGEAEYDELFLLALTTENGLVGRVVQDVVTEPPRKWLRVQGSAGAMEWTGSATEDRVAQSVYGAQQSEERFAKTRPDDFVAELTHLDEALDSGTPSPIDLVHGLDTMLVVAAAHLSQQTGRVVEIEPSKGYRPEALRPVE